MYTQNEPVDFITCTFYFALVFMSLKTVMSMNKIRDIPTNMSPYISLSHTEQKEAFAYRSQTFLCLIRRVQEVKKHNSTQTNKQLFSGTGPWSVLAKQRLKWLSALDLAS